MSHPSFAHEPAYAKINLALQLIHRLPNGYHRLDSVVAFVDSGDMLEAAVSEDSALHLTIEGAFAKGLSTTDNLVIRAAEALQAHAAVPFGASLRLHKHIPVGAGLGGGSADAAAALRLLNRLWGCNYSLPMLAELAAPLGADVPACVFSNGLRMEGIGDVLTPVIHLPKFAVLLVYPRTPLWTAEVYGAVEQGDFSGQLPPLPAMGAAHGQWQHWLQESRNDLEQPARRLSADINEMVSVLAASSHCLLARMSGSGSACFGLYAEIAHARAAEAEIQQAHPQWWTRPSMVLAG